MDILLPKTKSENEILIEDLNDNYVILAQTVDMCYVLKKVKRGDELVYMWEEPQGDNAFSGIYYKSIRQAIFSCHVSRRQAKFKAFLNRK